MPRPKRVLPLLFVVLVYGAAVPVAAAVIQAGAAGAVGARPELARSTTTDIGAPAATADPADQVHLRLPVALNGPPPEAPGFSLQVVPAAITNSVPGQECVFLVTVQDHAFGSAGAVTLTASAPGATVRVEPAAVRPGTVAEVVVIPGLGSQEQTLPVTIRGQRGGAGSTVAASLDVLADMPGLDEERGATAAEMLQPFLPWLAEHHPELGIGPDTTWRRTVVTPQILVVMHYLFFSEDWEVHVAWHVMIPPHDWTRIDLRRRTTQTQPSLAFEISSRGNQTEPIEIEPPESIWR